MCKVSVTVAHTLVVTFIALKTQQYSIVIIKKIVYICSHIIKLIVTTPTYHKYYIFTCMDVVILKGEHGLYIHVCSKHTDLFHMITS